MKNYERGTIYYIHETSRLSGKNSVKMKVIETQEQKLQMILSRYTEDRRTKIIIKLQLFKEIRVI